MRAKILFVAKAAISGGLIAYILSRVDVQAIWKTLQHASVEWILLALGFHILGLCVGAYRWKLLLSVHTHNYSYGYLVRSLMIGWFFNQFFPSTVGGDAVRAYHTPSDKGHHIPGVSAIVVERLGGVFVILGIGTGAVLWLDNPVTDALRIPLLIMFVGSIVGLAVLTRAPVRNWVGRRLGAGNDGRGIRGMLYRFLDSIQVYVRRPRLVGRALVATSVLQLIVILCWVVLARALELGIPIQEFFLVIPVLMLLFILPISINGIGIRESGLVVLLLPLGIEPHGAVALAWLDYGVKLAWGLVGGGVYLMHRRKRIGQDRESFPSEQPADLQGIGKR